jgi:hypothetical protein
MALKSIAARPRRGVPGEGKTPRPEIAPAHGAAPARAARCISERETIGSQERVAGVQGRPASHEVTRVSSAPPVLARVRVEGVVFAVFAGPVRHLAGAALLGLSFGCRGLTSGPALDGFAFGARGLKAGAAADGALCD